MTPVTTRDALLSSPISLSEVVHSRDLVVETAGGVVVRFAFDAFGELVNVWTDVGIGAPERQGETRPEQAERVAALLTSLYSTDEMRRAAPCGFGVKEACIPEPPCTPDFLARTLVAAAIAGRGLQPMFARMRADRPRRVADIDRVAGECGEVAR